jgi:RHS repeat-associated protein
MMRRQHSIVVFLLVMLSAAVHAFAQSVYEPPPAPPRKMPTPIPAAIGGVQRPQTLAFGDNGESGTYTYDGSGNITAIGSDAFLYDAEGRLKTAVIRAVTGSYTYDAFGNRKTATGETNCSGQTVCATPLTLDSNTNRLRTTTNGTTTDVGYDDAGNITSVSGGSYAYDGTGMMTEATVGSDDRQFVYTADDERIAVRQGQSWTWTVRGLDNKVLREFTSTEPNASPGFPAAGGTWIKDYIWRDGLLLASVATSTSGNVTWHYHLDHLGTPRLITNASSVKVAEHAYYPFGAEISLTPHESNEEAMKFTGHERDGVAGDGHTLDDMHARYYNASLGRFLSRDPELGVDYAVRHPQAWNRYDYSQNNPIVDIDPDGRADAKQILEAAAAAALAPELGYYYAQFITEAAVDAVLPQPPATNGEVQPTYFEAALVAPLTPAAPALCAEAAVTVNAEAPSSRVLSQNIEAAGTVRPPDSAAHHIVAGSDARAAEARAVLQREGVGINHADNGVFLPKNTSVPNPSGAQVHSTVHTNVYYNAVNAALRSASAGTVRDVLVDIANQLLGGGFPH